MRPSAFGPRPRRPWILNPRDRRPSPELPNVPIKQTKRSPQRLTAHCLNRLRLSSAPLLRPAANSGVARTALRTIQKMQQGPAQYNPPGTCFSWPFFALAAPGGGLPVAVASCLNDHRPAHCGLCQLLPACAPPCVALGATGSTPSSKQQQQHCAAMPPGLKRRSVRGLELLARSLSP